MQRRFDRPVLSIALALAALPADAASLQATPISMEVLAPSATSVLTLRNSGDTPLQAQVRVMQWSQVDGEDKLVPATDVVASPPMTAIGPKGEQLVRLVRVSKAPVSKEETYRLVVDEVPDRSAVKAGQIGFAMRYSIPVFFVPAPGAKSSLAWSVESRDGKTYLTATNTGARRVRLSELAVRDGSGRAVSFGKGLNGYVLARSSHRWAVPANSKLSLSGPIVITATGDDGLINAQATAHSSAKTTR